MRHSISLITLVVALNSFGQQKPMAEYRDRNAAAIYSAVMAHKIAKGQIPLIAIQTDPEINDEHEKTCLRESKVVDQSLVEKFLYENARPLLLPKDIPLDFPHQFAANSEIEAFFKAGSIKGWERFRAQYPNSGGYYVFSAISYDKAGSTALVYVARHCGPLCGDGWYIIMKKVDRKWVEAKRQPSCGWVS